MRIMKINLCYMFSKKSMLLIFLSFFFMMIIFSFKAFELKTLPNEIAIKSYYLENYYIIKLIYYFMVIYIWINSFSFENINYYYVLISKKNTRFVFVLSKIIVLILISLFFNIDIFFIFNIIGKIIINDYNITNTLMNTYFSIFLVSTVYGLIGSIFQLIIQNNYVLIFSYIISVISIITENESKKIIIPNSLMNWIVLIVVIVVLMMILFLIFDSIDLNE